MRKCLQFITQLITILNIFQAWIKLKDSVDAKNQSPEDIKKFCKEKVKHLK